MKAANGEFHNFKFDAFVRKTHEGLCPWNK